jgi:Protein of unknown function (DUF3489)
MSVAVGTGSRLGRAFWDKPHRAICLDGAEVVRRTASHKPHEAPMTRTKSQRKPIAKSRPMKKSTRRKSSEPQVRADAASAALGTTRSGTKSAQVVAMLNDQAGTTIAAISAATGWQEHSVRGFLAGVIRKKLGLNLVSEPAESGRLYRISGTSTNRVKQSA